MAKFVPNPAFVGKFEDKSWQSLLQCKSSKIQARFVQTKKKKKVNAETMFMISKAHKNYKYLQRTK